MSTVKRYGKKIFHLAIFVAIFAFFIFLLEMGLKFFQVQSFLIPLPSQVFKVMVSQFSFLLMNTGVTMIEAIVGFFIGNAVAYALALIFVRFPVMEKMGLAGAVAVKSTPVIVLAPLFIIWFGNGIFGKCLMAGLVCFFPMLINSVVGLRAVEPDILNYLRSLGASDIQILRIVRIPSSLPYVMAAAKTSSTISIVGAIIAELAGSDWGVGAIFLKSIWFLRTEQMFAAIIFVAIAGIIFYALVSLPSRFLAKRGFKEMANVA